MSDGGAAAGAVLGTFVGDALGARWEGPAPARGPRAAGRVETSLVDGTTLTYTDDTQLARRLDRLAGDLGDREAD